MKKTNWERIFQVDEFYSFQKKNMENVAKHRYIKLVGIQKKKKLYGMWTKLTYKTFLFWKSFSNGNEKNSNPHEWNLSI